MIRNKKDPFDDIWDSVKTRSPRCKDSCAWCYKVRPSWMLKYTTITGTVCEICVDSHGR